MKNLLLIIPLFLSFNLYSYTSIYDIILADVIAERDNALAEILASAEAERDAALAAQTTAETFRDTALGKASAEAERDARPTQAAYDAVVAERDARYTEEEYNAVVTKETPDPLKPIGDAVVADRIQDLQAAYDSVVAERDARNKSEVRDLRLAVVC